MLAHPKGVKNDRNHPTGTRNAILKKCSMGCMGSVGSGCEVKCRVSMDITDTMSIRRMLPNSQVIKISFLVRCWVKNIFL